MSSEKLKHRTSKKNNMLSPTESSNPKIDPALEVVEEAGSLRLNPPPQKTKHPIAVLITALFMGVVFGFLFVRSRVYEPIRIRQQFILEDFSMMKMFLAAMSASSLVYIMMSLFHMEDFQGMRDRRANSGSGRGLGWVATGGLLLGSGMSIGGACPGMVLSQFGSGVENAWATLVGGLVGALVYGLFEPFLRGHIKKNARGIDKAKSLHLEHHLGISFRHVSLGVFVFAAVVAVVLEVVFYWKEGMAVPNEEGCIPFFTCRGVAPAIAGLLLGLLQVPTFYIMNSALGSSSCYVTIAGSWVQAHPTAQEVFQYFKNATAFNMSTWWQVFYMGAAVGGSALAQYASGGPPAQGIPVWQGFLGGFIMLFGARVAAGCTSGHGLSGMPLLMLNSLVAVVSMFAGGFATGFTFSAIDRNSYLQITPGA